MGKLFWWILALGGTMSSLAQPVIIQQPTNQTVLNGSNVVLAVQVSGTGPFTYQWQFNGTNLPNNIITTIAGNGTNGFSGDGGMATNASLTGPNSAVMDAAGNLFIAARSRIREVTTNGIISTFAGGGNNYPGDGGLATNAALIDAVGMAIDANSSNVFVADYAFGSSRIHKIDNNGIITTVAGGGANNYPSGIMATNADIDASDVAVDNVGDLFIAGYDANVVYKVNGSGIITIVAGQLKQGTPGYSGDGGAATNANLSYPQAVALDTSGNLFIADVLNQRVRKVDTNGIITTVAGNGTKVYSGDGVLATNTGLPGGIGGVAVDAHGNLFFSDVSWIRQVDTNGIITTVAGNGTNGYSGDGGAATNASLNQPQRISVDAAGNLLIADFLNHRVRKIALAGSPTLMLNNVTVTNVGTYSVTITSPDGSTTSSNAVLTVIVPPSISAALAVDGSCSLNWSAQSNFIYQLQYTTNLVAPVWQNLGSPITATNGTVSTSDIPGEDLQRFYRVQLVQ
jgi:hypothetical protein